MNTNKYKAKPIVIEAIQYTKGNGSKVAKFMGAVDFTEEFTHIPNTMAKLSVIVVQDMTYFRYNICEGSYIVKYNDKFYCMSEDDFMDRYMEINNGTEKIDELKKLMGFGFLIIDSTKNDKNVQQLMETQSYNDLVPLMACFACAYDLEHTENRLSDMFNEPQTTKTLESVYSKYIEFKNSDEV